MSDEVKLLPCVTRASLQFADGSTVAIDFANGNSIDEALSKLRLASTGEARAIEATRRTGQGLGVPFGSGHSRAEPEEVSVVPTSVPNAEAHERLRIGFNAALEALLASDSDDVTLPRTALTPLLDYVGLREFTFAGSRLRREAQAEGTEA